MKRSSSGFVLIAQRCGLITALAAGIVLTAGCNDYGNTFQNPTGATITSLSQSRLHHSRQRHGIHCQDRGAVESKDDCLDANHG